MELLKISWKIEFRTFWWPRIPVDHVTDTVAQPQNPFFWKCLDSNPGLLGEKPKCSLCATLPPFQRSKSILPNQRNDPRYQIIYSSESIHWIHPLCPYWFWDEGILSQESSEKPSDGVITKKWICRWKWQCVKLCVCVRVCVTCVGSACVCVCMWGRSACECMCVYLNV